MSAFPRGSPKGSPKGPQPITEQTFIVAIDAGHGGTNLGCVGDDGVSREKDFTLELAFAVRRRLLERVPDAGVVLTRTKDQSMTLAQRVAVANAANADLFISLHANASQERNQLGFETYVLDAEASNLDAARVARRENDQGLVEAGVTDSAPGVGTMLRQLEMTAHRAAAVRFAAGIQREQSDRFPQRLSRGVKQAPFDVLMGARMPAALFEAGFLDHEREGPWLRDPQQHKAIAEGIVEAIVEQYREQRQTR